MSTSNQTLNEHNLIIRKLSSEEILDIYITHSTRHFPENERKPASSVKKMCQEGIYVGYGLFHKENTEPLGHHPLLLCYALFTVVPHRQNILLDYFAVMEDYRSHGIGSVFLKYAKESMTEYGGILIESENPDYGENEEEVTLRNKRLEFYGKNGATFTGILAEIFGVPYRLLYLPLTKQHPSPGDLCADFDCIYRHMVSQKNYENHVRIQMPQASRDM